MINVTINPFSNSNFQSERSVVDNIALPNCAARPPASLLASWNNQDEYVPSASSSYLFSDTYKRSSLSVVSSTSEETVRSSQITDKMRQEMTYADGSHWSAMDLISVAYPTFYGIIDQVFEEKGIKEVVFEEGCTYNFSINPDGVFIFHPDEFNVSGVDAELAKDICLALESAVNSSTLNIKDNPQLFTKEWLSPDYDPAKWGRTFDREEWLSDRAPDFSEFISELRSDIYNLFPDLQITDFSMKIDDEGKLTITSVQTDRNDPKSNARVLERMNNELTSEINKKAAYLGLLLFADRNATHGDVLMEGMLEPFDDGSKGDIEQYKHEVVFTSGTNYNVVRADGRSN